MGNVGMFSAQELSTRLGWPMERLESIAFVVNLDAISFVDAWTGRRCWVTLDVLVRHSGQVIPSDCIVDSGISDDSGLFV